MPSAIVGSVMMLAISVAMVGAVATTAVQLAGAIDRQAQVQACYIAWLTYQSTGVPAPGECDLYLGDYRDPGEPRDHELPERGEPIVGNATVAA